MVSDSANLATQEEYSSFATKSLKVFNDAQALSSYLIYNFLDENLWSPSRNLNEGA